MTKKTHRQLFLSSPLSPRELSRPCPCSAAASSSSSRAGFGTTPTVSTSPSPSSTTTRTTMPSTSSTTTRTTMPSTPSSGEGHLHHSYWQACVFSQSLPDLKMKWTIILVKKNKQISIKLTFLHGLGLISKLALNCLLCAAVNIVRGRFGPLVLSWLYTLCHFCINISAIVIINACIIMACWLSWYSCN